MKQITDGKKLNRIIIRLAHEIIERNGGTDDVVLIGLRSEGVTVARRIQEEIYTTEGIRLPLGTLDVTLYRDDLLSAENLVQQLTVIDFSLEGKRVVLCDDVVYTGRTLRAAISALFAIGRPKKIQFLVIADRGKRQLPFAADYVGKNCFAQEEEKIVVRLSDKKDGIEDIDGIFV